MNIYIKIIFKIILGLALFVFTVDVGVQFFFHDDIVKKIKAVSEKGMESKLGFNDVRISAIKHFPNLSITIDSLYVIEEQYEIIHAELIELQIGIFDLFDGNIRLSKLLIEDLKILVPVDSLGNKHMIKPRQIKGGNIHHGRSNVKLDIPNIVINRAEILVDNKFKKNRIKISVDSAGFRLRSFDDLLEFKGDAYATLDTLISKGELSLTNLPLLALGTTFRVNTLDKKKLFDGILGIADARLQAYGVLSPVGNGSALDVTLDGDDGSLDSYISVFPALSQLNFHQSNPDAEMKLKVNLSGFIGPQQFPYIDMKFEVKNGQFSREGLDGILDSVDFKGTYSNGKLSAPKSSSFVIEHGRARLEKSFVNIQGRVFDFTDPNLDLQLDSKIDLEELKLFLNYPNLVLDGIASIEIDFKGKLSDLKLDKKSNKEQFKGLIRFDSLSVFAEESKIDIQNLNGILHIANQKMQLQYLNGVYNHALIEVKGSIDDFFPLIDEKSRKLALANIEIKIDELTIPVIENKKTTTNRKNGNGYRFLPSLLRLNVNLTANKLRYRDQEISALTMRVEINSDSLLIKNTRFQFEKGFISLKAKSRLTKDSTMDQSLWIKANLKRLNLDKFIKMGKKGGVLELPNVKVFADVSIDEFFYQNVILKDVILEADFEDDILSTSTLGFSFPFGHFNSSFTMNMEKSPYELDGFSNINLLAFEVDSLKSYFNTLTALSKRTNKEENKELLDVEKFVVTLQSPRITYKEYQVNNFSTNLRFEKNLVRLNQSHFMMYGGQVDLSGLLYGQESGDIHAYCNISADDIDLSAVIDGFAEKNKGLFTGQNFKGKVGLEGKVLLKYNKEFTHKEDELVGKINLKLQDAELIDFKPISESLKFIKQENRDNIYLTNPNVELLFLNSELIISPTVFQTTLTNIEFAGYHSTDFEFGFDMQVSVSQLLFKSQKKKESSVKKNKENVKFGIMKYYLSARTQDGKMGVSPIKKRTYRKHLDLLANRKYEVDSVLKMMDQEMLD